MAMTPYLSKMMIYHQVHQMARDGFSIAYISKHLGLNWRTAKRLLAIEDDRDYEQYLQAAGDKDKLLQPYEGFIKGKLELYRDTSSAQMHDWLKEHFPDFAVVSAKTVFNYVAWVRQKYHLPRTESIRIYEMVEETPYGMQAQIDFGEYNLRDTQGRRVKVHFFLLVLSRSRYKYVQFSDQRFTAATAIDAHEQAFRFIEGIPDTLVYDQDRVFMVDENQGDLILTDAFKAYSRERAFKLHFCRRSDPESKGKVENAVKYVKQNFLYNRPFSHIEVLNCEARAWLGRTANHMVHNGTRKRPEEQWSIEKPFLRELPATAIALPPPLLYTVRKDNSISYKGNFYSLPSHTYKGRGSQVPISRNNDLLIMCDTDQRELCRHTIGLFKGEKIINNDHKRDKSPAIRELEDQVCTLLADQDMGRRLVAAIRQDKPRYIRDQLLLLKQIISDSSADIISLTLEYCCSHHINGAADFKAIAAHYKASQYNLQAGEQTGQHLYFNPLSNKMPDQALVQPATSSINDYDMF